MYIYIQKYFFKKGVHKQKGGALENRATCSAKRYGARRGKNARYMLRGAIEAARGQIACTRAAKRKPSVITDGWRRGAALPKKR